MSAMYDSLILLPLNTAQYNLFPFLKLEKNATDW